MLMASDGTRWLETRFFRYYPGLRQRTDKGKEKKRKEKKKKRKEKKRKRKEEEKQMKKKAQHRALLRVPLATDGRRRRQM